ncbi:MAG: tripartite tricarboxylate transporter substrate binding protein [Ferrovibrio sp.]|uniref:Bug family tripartite tricarboxylate transporter substrate binding protein n=1 Tax=Ferrovibrio sp. TaxID=1917215 RepID=UPI0026244039|nr:tripartite tricarboxylate transporter substrate binding protein [Ferrovibrio sp.]MCW0235071.1 tripartite tricarboxylate transporter substrate binding protein [Ferrovibrio sp.]
MKKIATVSLTLAMATTLAAGAAMAQAWPERPIRMVVGFGAGGGTDIIARIVAQPLSDILGQPVVVENKPGAGGTIGADFVAKAPKDGHTIFMMNNGHAVSATLYKSLPYDSEKSFAPVSLVATMPLVITANKDLAATDGKSLIALIKSQPGKIRFASVGVGSTQHFAGLVFRNMSGGEIRHIPYRGTPAAIAAVRGGEVELLFEVAAPVVGQIKGGELKALAVTSAKRFPALPDVPTVAEAGLKAYDVTTWYGLAFPAGTPEPIVAKMNAAIKTALGKPEVRKQVEEANFLPEISTAPAFTAHLGSEIKRWGKVMQDDGIQQQ